MRRSIIPLLALLCVTPVGAQDAPHATAPTLDPVTGAANQAALAATAQQTSDIIKVRETNARNQAAFERAQADYLVKMKSYEVEKAEVARRTAEAAAAADTYREQMAAWRGKARPPAAATRPVLAESAPTPVVATAPALPKPAPAAPANSKNPSRRQCTYEQPTGSNLPVRVCRAS